MYRDPVTGLPQGGVKKVSYTHEDLAHTILSNPGITQVELAARYGYTPGWVSQIIASDAFQAFLNERKEKIVDPLLRGAIEESFKGLVLQSMERLRAKLEANPSDQLCIEVLRSSSRALGYGVKPTTQVTVGGNLSLIGILSAQPKELPMAPALEGVAS